MNKLRLKKARTGTSIVEAVVAIALIGIMLLWTMTLYANSSKNSVTTADIEIATHLASDRIEYLKTLTKEEIKDELSNHSGRQQFPSTYENYEYYEYEYFDLEEQVNTIGGSTVWLKDIEVVVYKKGESTPIIRMECNFLRRDSDETNIGT
jgi:ABC-type lipoprotein release transport system permease subunit